jgi:hypothetical protein
MLGTQPPRDADKPSHKLDNPAAAATEIMWAVALATARAAVASTARGLEIWSQILRAPTGSPAWPIFAKPFTDAIAQGPNPGADGAVPPGPSAQGTPAEAAPGEAPAFASYRSSSGHAAAQVSKPH